VVEENSPKEAEDKKESEPGAFFKAEFDLEKGAERVAQVLIDAAEEVEKIEKDVERHLKGHKD